MMRSPDWLYSLLKPIMCSLLWNLCPMSHLPLHMSMSVCVCVCVCMRVCVCVCVCVSKCLCASVCLSVCLSLHICGYACLCVCVCVCVCAVSCIFVTVCLLKYAYYKVGVVQIFSHYILLIFSFLQRTIISTKWKGMHTQHSTVQICDRICKTRKNTTK